MRILVIDDDPMAAELTAAIVVELGHDAVTAENGIDGAEQLGDGSTFDLILSDQNMPMISGIELFRELRRQNCAVPFILLTGDNPATALATEPALDGCLMKDFSLQDELPALLARITSQNR